MRCGRRWKLLTQRRLRFRSRESRKQTAPSLTLELRGRLGKPIVAVLPNADPSRVGELPSDVSGRAVFDGSKVATEALAKSIVTALEAS